MINKPQSKERSFSVQLNSKVNLTSVTLTSHSQENVLVEGTIGELQRAEFAEGIVLEIVGSKGVLRIDLSENEITREAKKQ